ncbi:hypothetical protein [Natranaerobius thermophilus]|uniref:Uncharacterized protein n=1 Tax=Natranaerobius thermophilus (strain ATCC BAA-1301 / DSM 18059 / JW/NM-WN-LF) TaxID=457570 RepID=B2A219_NATTJ|nr:hypothetical protein [Natranaerobius thermophilus]ACB84824.1 hypothetical protein Nther_1241 [Natranaerobius thermophilus JW/NM-WN-LF]
MNKKTQDILNLIDEFKEQEKGQKEKMFTELYKLEEQVDEITKKLLNQ